MKHSKWIAALGGMLLVGGMATGAMADGPAPAKKAAKAAPAKAAPAPAAEAYSRPHIGHWSGYYIGAHVGAAWGDQSWSMQNGAFREDFDHSPSGTVYGMQVGVQHQFDRIVAGIEVSFTGSYNLSDSSDAGNPALTGVGRVRQTDFDSITLVAARLGLPMGSFMPYLRIGYAAGRVSFHSGNQSAPGIARLNGANEWSSGWNLGGGLEWTIHQHVTLAVQYDYVNLGGAERNYHTFTNGGAAPIFDVGDADIHMITARLNFMLGRRGEAPAAAPMK